MSKTKTVVPVADTFGVAQHSSGKWFSLSEEAFSSGAQMFATREQAEARDADHHAFMVAHHPDAKGDPPFINRALGEQR